MIRHVSTRSARSASVAIGLVIAVVLGLGAYAWAADSPANPSTANKSAAAAHPRLARLERLAKRSVHGEFVVKTKNGFETFDADKGTDVAAPAGSVSVHRADGPTVTVKVTSDTKFRGIKSAADIRAGKGIVVISKGGNAVLVAQRNGNADAS